MQTKRNSALLLIIWEVLDRWRGTYMRKKDLFNGEFLLIFAVWCKI